MEEFWIEHRTHQQGFHLPHHYENAYQMLFVMRGMIRFNVEAKSYLVKAGEMIILNTLEDHSLEVLEYPYERILVQASPFFFEKEVLCPEVISIFLKRPVNFSHHLKVNDATWNYFMDILHEMEQEYDKKQPYWDMYVGSNLRRMFITILREFQEEISTHVSDPGIVIAYQIMNYLNSHYTEDINVDAVADLVFHNKHYVSHIFKDKTGYSIMDYVITLRINRAKALLAESEMTVSDIAVECGYTDFAYFSRIFKKKTGQSPKSFRKEQKD